jgi:hypothetical protein
MRKLAFPPCAMAESRVKFAGTFHCCEILAQDESLLSKCAHGKAEDDPDAK